MSKRNNTRSNKREKRFYEPLIVLVALRQVLGDRIRGDPVSSDSGSSWGRVNTRRQMLHGLCMMCDYDKGGDTVNAIALEERPEGPMYWVACNDGADSKIKPFLTEILEKLKDTAQPNIKAGILDELTEWLFQTFTEFNLPRLKKTWELLQKELRIESEKVDGDESLIGKHVWHNAFKTRPTK